MSGRGIRVTVEDLETGDKDVREFDNDYALICVGSVFLDSTVTHANGTHVLTVKRASRKVAS